MMRSLHTLRRLSGNLLVLTACASVSVAYAQPRPAKPGPAAAKPAAQGDQMVDGIAAIVNKDVITLREVDIAAQNATKDLKQRGIQVPPHDILRRQVLQSLIMERVQTQEADRLGIRVNDSQIDQAIASIAQRNRMSVANMKVEVEKSGVTWDQYRKSLSSDLRMNRLRQRAVDSNIMISDAEVDAFLKDQQTNPAARAGAGAPAPAPGQAAPQPRAQSGPEQVALGQILVRVPEGSTPEQVATLRKKAENILARLKQGSDFASLAAESSDGPEALQGGVMGARPINGWPDLFVQAVSSLQPGQVSNVIQSGNGFHILKVLDRAGGAAASAPAQPAQPAAPQGPVVAPHPGAGMPANQGPVRVTQTHARHILIKTSAVMSDDQARQRLEQIRQRVVNGGATFSDMARQYSEDNNAPQGGDLGWVNPGEMVPAFEQAMNTVPVGGISEPVLSPFGWHLIQVEERREHDVSDELQRMQARQILFERRAEPAFEDWLEQLRNSAYIDNRLEKQISIDQNNR